EVGVLEFALDVEVDDRSEDDGGAGGSGGAVGVGIVGVGCIGGAVGAGGQLGHREAASPKGRAEGGMGLVGGRERCSSGPRPWASTRAGAGPSATVRARPSAGTVGERLS